jgi:hypothetical protein
MKKPPTAHLVPIWKGNDHLNQGVLRVSLTLLLKLSQSGLYKVFVYLGTVTSRRNCEYSQGMLHFKF